MQPQLAARLKKHVLFVLLSLSGSTTPKKLWKSKSRPGNKTSHVSRPTGGAMCYNCSSKREQVSPYRNRGSWTWTQSIFPLSAQVVIIKIPSLSPAYVRSTAQPVCEANWAVTLRTSPLPSPDEGHPSPKVLGKYFFFIEPTGVYYNCYRAWLLLHLCSRGTHAAPEDCEF